MEIDIDYILYSNVLLFLFLFLQLFILERYKTHVFHSIFTWSWL